MLKDKKDLDNENRLENIKELISAMKEYDNLESFLEHVALATSLDQDWEDKKINLMTMHSMNRFYQGDWIDSLASRFIDELPEKY